jgi:hypothetical protein
MRADYVGFDKYVWLTCPRRNALTTTYNLHDFVKTDRKLVGMYDPKTGERLWK